MAGGNDVSKSVIVGVVCIEEMGIVFVFIFVQYCMFMTFNICSNPKLTEK